MSRSFESTVGPIDADQLQEDERYELRNGRAIYCAPSGRSHAGRSLTGGALLGTDPAVEWAGVDAGYSLAPGELRAPDIAVGPDGEESGWIPGTPPLAVEYAGSGQDETELVFKIADLLKAGTRSVWVVRLVGPQRVEVHEPGRAMRTVGIGDTLEAPGILRNPVPVHALFDREASFPLMLRNLLQRRGYDDLEAVLAEGREQGRREGREEGKLEGLEEGNLRGLRQSLLEVIAARGIALDLEGEQRIAACRDTDQLASWLRQAIASSSLAEVLAG